MDTKKLRQKILDLAIRGKLVPQDPNDEPASVLLESIRAEKERLIAEGKIKRSKKSKASSAESHYQNFTPPFEIPDSWEWVRLGEICDVARGGSPRPIKSFLTTQDDGINWIKIGDTDKDGKYISSTKERIIPSGVSKSRLVHKGDFLLTNSMSFGRPYILNIDGCIHDGWLVISPVGNVFDKNFLYLLLSSGYAFNQFRDQASGSAVSNLNSDKVADSLFPLPPIKAQERIVEEYEKLSIFIQELDSNKDNLKSVMHLAKSKILDLAMQGKLVPQDPTDEPAADMLRRINPKAKIITDNPHYPQLPDNWVATHFTDVCDAKLGKTLNKSTDEGVMMDYLCAVNVKDGYFDLNNIKQSKFQTDEFERYSVYKGDLLICEGGDVGRCAIWNGERILYQNALHRVRPLKGIEQEYLHYFLLYAKNKLWIDKLCSGVTIKHFTTKAMSNLIITIPPHNEQKSIIDNIKSLFVLLEEIEVSLKD